MKPIPKKITVRQFYCDDKWYATKPFYRIYFPNGYYVASEQELNVRIKEYWNKYYEA